MLRDELKDALKTAMLAKEEKAVGTIRMIMAKMKDQDIAARP
ncbi:MAG: GatB/YqeY domain-containing protein, partial [Alphaproteobacteria bacterium]|nr:GatB/YqeY domain-containing protein [Alphaproteobacteria bacterium]